MKKSLSYRFSALALSYDTLLLAYEQGDSFVFVEALDIYYGNDEAHQKFLQLMDEAVSHADDFGDADSLRKFKEWSDATKAVYDDVQNSRSDEEACDFAADMTFQYLLVLPLFISFLVKFVEKLQKKGL